MKPSLKVGAWLSGMPAAVLSGVFTAAAIVVGLALCSRGSDNGILWLVAGATVWVGVFLPVMRRLPRAAQKPVVQPESESPPEEREPRSEIASTVTKAPALPRPPAASVSAPRSAQSPVARSIMFLAASIILVAVAAFAFLMPLETCPNCKGTAKFEIFSQRIATCEMCDGTGRLTLFQKIRGRTPR